MTASAKKSASAAAGAGRRLIVAVEREGRVLRATASEKGDVTWGPTLEADLVLPVPGLEGPSALFARGESVGRLLIEPDMDGEVSAGSTRIPFADLDLFGLLRRKGSECYVELTPHMTGWFTSRGLTVRFTYAEVPDEIRRAMEALEAKRVEEAEARKAEEKKRKAAEKEALREAKARDKVQRIPREFRRPVFSRDDLPFTILSWSLYGLLILLSLYLGSIEIVETPETQVVPERFARLKYEVGQAKTRVKQELERKKKEEEAAEQKKAEEAKVVEEEKVEEKAPEPEKKPEPKAEEKPAEAAPAEPVQTIEERRAAIRQEVSKKGLLGVLGGRGGTTLSSGRASVLSGGGRAADLDKALENVEGLRAGGSGDNWKGRTVDDAGAAVGEGARRAGAAGERVTAIEQRAAAEVESVEVGELDELSMKEAVAAIHRTVDTYLGGIRYLYNRELRKNPDLEGKVTIAITIDPTGSVVKAEVVETTLDSPELVDAILARVKRWTFPPVAPKTITVSYPFVFFPTM